MKIASEPNLRAAAEAHREPFLWFPAIDQISNGSVPQLLRRLARDYKKFGKPFLLAETHDSGVYPGETWWLIPKDSGVQWARKHLAPLIATTKLFDKVQCPYCGSLVDVGDTGD